MRAQFLTAARGCTVVCDQRQLSMERGGGETGEEREDEEKGVRGGGGGALWLVMGSSCQPSKVSLPVRVTC